MDKIISWINISISRGANVIDDIQQQHSSKAVNKAQRKKAKDFIRKIIQ
jgi:hypothetical protein